MTDKEIIDWCNDFSAPIIGEDVEGKCYMVCAPLSTLLEMMGINNKITETELKIGNDYYNHYFLTLNDGRILDPTADQFNKISGYEMPRTYLGIKPEWYETK